MSLRQPLGDELTVLGAAVKPRRSTELLALFLAVVLVASATIRTAIALPPSPPVQVATWSDDHANLSAMARFWRWLAIVGRGYQVEHPNGSFLVMDGGDGGGVSMYSPEPGVDWSARALALAPRLLGGRSSVDRPARVYVARTMGNHGAHDLADRLGRYPEYEVASPNQFFVDSEGQYQALARTMAPLDAPAPSLLSANARLSARAQGLIEPRADYPISALPEHGRFRVIGLTTTEFQAKSVHVREAPHTLIESMGGLLPTLIAELRRAQDDRERLELRFVIVQTHEGWEGLELQLKSYVDAYMASEVGRQLPIVAVTAAHDHEIKRAHWGTASHPTLLIDAGSAFEAATFRVEATERGYRVNSSSVKFWGAEAQAAQVRSRVRSHAIRAATGSIPGESDELAKFLAAIESQVERVEGALRSVVLSPSVREAIPAKSDLKRGVHPMGWVFADVLRELATTSWHEGRGTLAFGAPSAPLSAGWFHCSAYRCDDPTLPGAPLTRLEVVRGFPFQSGGPVVHVLRAADLRLAHQEVRLRRMGENKPSFSPYLSPNWRERWEGESLTLEVWDAVQGRWRIPDPNESVVVGVDQNLAINRFGYPVLGEVLGQRILGAYDPGLTTEAVFSERLVGAIARAEARVSAAGWQAATEHSVLMGPLPPALETCREAMNR